MIVIVIVIVIAIVIDYCHCYCYCHCCYCCHCYSHDRRYHGHCSESSLPSLRSFCHRHGLDSVYCDCVLFVVILMIIVAVDFVGDGGGM